MSRQQDGTWAITLELARRLDRLVTEYLASANLIALLNPRMQQRTESRYSFVRLDCTRLRLPFLGLSP